MAIFEHYKGGVYVKLGNATHTETGEKLVVYKDSDGKIWTRPYSMFYDKVEVEGKEVERFRFLGRF